GVDVAKRCKEFESTWEQAFTLKQLQQSSCAGVEDTFAHRWKHDCAGVDQQLCARRPREPLLAKRVDAVAVRTRRDPQQTAFGFNIVTAPREHRGILSQQLFQTFDVVVMNDTSSLRDRPLQSLV